MPDGNGVPLRNLPGNPLPKFRLVPDYVSTKGGAVAKICELAGEVPDDWHQDFWDGMLGVDKDGEWTATTGELEVARRNSKTWPVHRYVLARALILDGPPIVWTSYRSDAAIQAYREMGALLESSRWLRNQVNTIVAKNGLEGYRFKNGATISYRTRRQSPSEKSQGGRSLEAGLLVCDEDQDLNDEADSALSPLTATIPGAQRLYLGSAGHQDSTVKGRLIRSAEKGAPRLVCLRWNASEEDDLASEETWARHLPALNNHREGRKLTSQTIADFYEQMPSRKFAREWMSIGDYPKEAGSPWIIPEPMYRATLDPLSAATGALVWSLEVAHDLESASISVAGVRSDGATHLETVKHQIGYRWAVPTLTELVRRHPTRGVVVNFRGATGAIRGAMSDAGFTTKTTLLDIASVDQAEAFSTFYSAFAAPSTIRHRGAVLLERAFGAARTRKTSMGATTWSAIAEEDVTPLLSWTWAYFGLQTLGRQKIVASPPPQSLVGPRGGATLGVDLATVSF